MATKFPILPHFPINADDQACLSASAAFAFFVFVFALNPRWNLSFIFCNRPVLENKKSICYESATFRLKRAE